MWNERLYSRQMSVISPRLSRRGAVGSRAAGASAELRRVSVARPPKGPRGTAALAKTVDLLDRIALAEAPPTFAALVTATKLPRGTLHRLLGALIGHRLVDATADERRYVVGVHLLELARRSWESSDLRRAAAEAIGELHRRTGETVHLALLDDDGVVYIDKVESDHPLRLHSAIGKRGPVHCTAVGKVMAAYLDDARQRALVARLDLVRHTPATLISRSGLLKALRDIRARGVAFDHEEHATGIHCVAAPVFDFRGRCAGGISITAPTARVDARQLAGFAKLVADAAAKTTAKLGGVAPPQPASREAQRR
jgi:DNA-binding IclR family transcriptional regulator